MHHNASRLIHIVLMAKMCVITWVFTIYLLRAFICSCVSNLFVFIVLSVKWAIEDTTIYWWRCWWWWWCCRFSLDDYVDDLSNRTLFFLFFFLFFTCSIALTKQNLVTTCVVYDQMPTKWATSVLMFIDISIKWSD